jgi:hypothetical protein
MVVDESRKFVQQRDGYLVAHNDHEIIKKYVEEIGQELKGK